MALNNAAPQSITMVVRSMTWECERVLSIVLTDPTGASTPSWEPGAHVDVSIPGVGLRQYSLCGDPANRSELRVGVLREEHSRGGSDYVHTQLRPGQSLTISPPRNNFALDEFDEYVFLAGGIGITPILPMIAAVNERGARWHLTYGGRRAASMAFVGELREYGDNVTLWPEDENGLMDLETILAPSSATATALYCCGPAPLLDAVEKHCADSALGMLRVERFAAENLPLSQSADISSFDVVLAGSGRTVTVREDQSILEALESEGLAPLSSCLQGIYGTCETPVLEGIPDHRDSLLTDDEKKANNTMFLCVSRARS